MASDTRRSAPRAAALLLAAACALALAACCHCGHDEPTAPVLPALPTAPPPAAAAFAAAHNARTAGLARLWSRAQLQIDGLDADGNKVRETVDGHFILEQPAKLHMRISKFSEPYFLLGSDDTRFWWFDLSTENRTAYVGHHASATRAQVERFGLPVHPLDLVELLAISPISPAALADPAVKTRWVSMTDAEIDLPARWGRRQIRFDAATNEPRGVTLTDEHGATAVRSELSEFEPVPILAGDGQGPRFEHRVILHLSDEPTPPGAPATRGPRLTVLILLYPELKTIAPSLFDLDALKERQSIRTTKLLDPATPPAGAPK